MKKTEQNAQQEETTTKKPYVRPTLTEWGTVADLTNSGGEDPSGDPMGGSVFCGT